MIRAGVLLLVLAITGLRGPAHSQNLEEITDYICQHYKALARTDIAAKNQISGRIEEPYSKWRHYENEQFPDYLTAQGPLARAHDYNWYSFKPSANMNYLSCTFSTFLGVGTECRMRLNISEQEERYANDKLRNCVSMNSYGEFEWRELLHGFENTHSNSIAAFYLTISSKDNFFGLKISGNPGGAEQFRRYSDSRK